jgi:predicted transcriptional regulator
MISVFSIYLTNNFLSGEYMEDEDLSNLLVIEPVAQPPPTEERAKTKKIPEETRLKVVELQKEGKSVREIGNLLGISKSTVSTISKEKRVVPVEISEPVAEQPMEDAAFARAITGAPTIAPARPQKGRVPADILKAFMNIDAPKAAKPRAKASSNLLAQFADLDSSAPTQRLAKVDTPFEDKSVYITKIQMNVDNFPEVLRDIIKPDRDTYVAKVYKMNVGELAQTLKLIETVRSSNNMANQMKYLLYGATGLIEMGSQRFLGMKTAGYAQQVRQQEAEIQSCLREIAINNVERYKSVEKPEMRLASVLVMTLLATDSRNRLEEYRGRNVSPEQADEFKEL